MSKKMKQDVAQQSAIQTEEISLTDETVVSFLEDNPSFFLRHPELLTTLRLDDNQRGTVSLVERQQQLLRSKVHSLEEEITHLMSMANQNEQLFVLYSDLYLRLIDCQDANELLDCLHQAITELLSLSGLKVWLTQTADIIHPSITTNDCQAILANRLTANEHYYFGRLQQSEQQLIFSEVIDGSVVLIKLQHQEQVLGFIAISSQDAEHFDPRMDTLLISQFTRLVAKLLHQHLYT